MGKTVSTGSALPVYHFNSKCILSTPVYVSEFASSLTNTNFIDNLASLFTNKEQYVNSVRWYPFNLALFMTVDVSTTNLTLGGREARWGGTQTFPVPVYLCSDVIRAKKICSIAIPTEYNSFLDYEPYTTAQIYLPYLGFYALPIKDCMGKTVDVYYSVDFDTGVATAYLEVQTTPSTDSRVILTASGKIGIDIPVGGDNANEIAKDAFQNSMKLLASGIAIAGGISAGKVAGGMIAVKGVETAMSSGVNFITDQQRHYQRGSLTGGQDALPSPTDVYVVINRPRIKQDNMSIFAELKGRPLGESRQLSTVYGFTIVEEVRLSGFGTALKSEIDEIESLLHQGVILPQIP